MCRGATLAFRTVLASGMIASESRETDRPAFTRLASARWRQADLSACHRSRFCSASRDRPTDRFPLQIYRFFFDCKCSSLGAIQNGFSDSFTREEETRHWKTNCAAVFGNVSRSSRNKRSQGNPREVESFEECIFNG